MSLSELGTHQKDEYISRFEAIIPPTLSDKVADVDALTESIGFPALVEDAVRSALGDSKLASFLLFVLGLAVLMALASQIGGKFQRTSECGVMLVSGVALFSNMYFVLTKTIETLGGVLSFYTSFAPVVTAVLAYGGSGTSAVSFAAGTNMTLGIIGTFVIPLLTSCVSLTFALGLVGAVGHEGTLGLARRVKSFFMWLVGLASFLLLSSVALQGVLASAKDTAAMRAAKYAASGAIPIVGGSVSSAMGALVGSVSYIKTVIGVGGVSVILLLTLSPLLTLLLYRFSLSVAEGFLDFIGVSFGVRIFSTFRASLDLLVSVYAISVTVLLIETALMMKSGVGVY